LEGVFPRLIFLRKPKVRGRATVLISRASPVSEKWVFLGCAGKSKIPASKPLPLAFSRCFSPCKGEAEEAGGKGWRASGPERQSLYPIGLLGSCELPLKPGPGMEPGADRYPGRPVENWGPPFGQTPQPPHQASSPKSCSSSALPARYSRVVRAQHRPAPAGCSSGQTPPSRSWGCWFR
jgi:hypothetical protein